MKKKLLVILGAGSSIPRGMPSVAALDEHMSEWGSGWSVADRDDQDLAGNSEVALLIRRWESPAEAERFLGVHSGTSAPSLAVNQTCTGYRRH
jgi:hypothetical protein